MTVIEHALSPNIARQQLADTITRELRRNGYYLAHLDSEGQDLYDLEWAASVASRTIGRTITTYVGNVGRRVPGKVTVMIRPRDTDQDGDRTEGYLQLLHAVMELPE